MFTTVQSLTRLIDIRLQYLKEGIESKDLHDADEYEKWLDDITKSLNGSIEKLKRFSSNYSLIARYENKVKKALSEI